MPPLFDSKFSLGSGRLRFTFLSGLALVLAQFFPAECRSASWLQQDLSPGFGRIKMADRGFVGRFGGGSWGRLNGADFDSDGDLDLVATFGAGSGARGTYSGLYVYENVGTPQTPRLDAGQALAFHEQIRAATPYVGDANQDSHPDIFCNGLLWLNQSQTGNLRFAPPSAAADPRWPHPAECDWNGDDVTDRFEEHRWQLRWLDGRSGRSRQLKVGQQELLMDVFIRPFVCDWDNDDDLDVLIGQESGHVTWAQNTNGRLLAEEYVMQSDPNVHSGCASVPVICDWDGDNDMDLIVGDAAGFIEFFEYQDGRFGEVQRLRAGAKEIRVLAGEFGSVQGPEEARWGYTCPEVADWDLDGDLDLLVGCVTGESLLYENIGVRTQARLAPAKKLTLYPPPVASAYPEGLRFVPEPGVLVTQWRCRPVVVDWNKDGLPDYVTVDEKGVLACYPRFRSQDGSLGLGPADYPFRDPDLVPLRFCSHPHPGRMARRTWITTSTSPTWNACAWMNTIRQSSNGEVN
jgi:hypothetical protein